MTAEKICIICGEDCSGRPRLKDPNGQYACQACVEAKKRPRQAPKAAPPTPAIALAQDDAPAAGAEIGFSMDDYLGDAPAPESSSTSHCPNCGSPKAAGTVVCMQCGYDSASGKAMSTKVRKAKVKKARLSGGAYALVFIVGMLVLLPVMALASDMAAVVALGITILWNFVAYIYMVGAAFRDEDTFWGILGALFWVPLAGGFCWLAFVLYYCIFGSQRGTRKLNYWASFFAQLIVAGIFVMNNPDLFADWGG